MFNPIVEVFTMLPLNSK